MNGPFRGAKRIKAGVPHRFEDSRPRVKPGVDEQGVRVAILQDLVGADYYVLALAQFELSPGKDHEFVSEKLAVPLPSTAG